MKNLFLIILALLTAWSVAIYVNRDKSTAEHPIIYWVTDNNPARLLQVETFHEWLDKNGYPKIELRLDVSNSDTTKKIIQSVSGVGGDIMDLPSNTLAFFNEAGLLEDLTEIGEEMGFSVDTTYDALESTLVLNDKLIGYPANVSVEGYMINLEAFEKVGMRPPPASWDVQTFERIGKEYVKRANEGLARNENFFAGNINRNTLYRSKGLSMYNETMTACTLNDPRYIAALELIHKWTYQDRILPSTADTASMSTDSGYGGQSLQLFVKGNYALLNIGRHGIILIRQIRPNMDLAVATSPYFEFENGNITARTAVMYSGGKNKEYAAYFFKFLASDEYNELISDDGDGLPPLPTATETKIYRAPSKYPNEVNFHVPYARIGNEVAVGSSYSPFLPASLAARIENDGYGAYMAGRATVEEAAAQVEKQINDEIQRSISRSPEMKKRWEEQYAIQQKIDELKAQKKPIPAKWVKNPFYLRYYELKGLLAETEENDNGI